MSCKIFRDKETDRLMEVTAPNGAASLLFKQALKTVSEEEGALSVWAYAYTNAFKDQYGDWQNNPTEFNLDKNGEPKFSSVFMNYFLNTSNQEKLGVTEAVNVYSMALNSGLSVPTLYSTLNQVFFNKDGQFVVDRKRLENSGLYTSEEVSNILQFPSVRGEILDTMKRLKYSLKEGSTLFENGLTEPETIVFNISTGKINSLGKMITIPNEEVISYLTENIQTYSSEEAFMSALTRLDREDIRDAILSSPEMINTIKEIVQNTVTVPTLVTRDGIMVQKSKEDPTEILLNTVTVNEDKVDFTEAADYLRDLTFDEWLDPNDSGVIEILREAEIRGAKIGLDLTGLSNQYNVKSREEIIGILDVIDDFNIKTEDLTVTDEDIIEVAQYLNEFFDRDVSPSYSTIFVPNRLKNKNLVQIEDNRDETSLYRTEGLIKIGDGLYERVDNINNFSEALEVVYEGLMEDVTLLPKEAFKNFGLRDGYYNVDAITNPENKQKVIESINAYLTKRADQLSSQDMEDYDTNKEIALMKAVLKVEDVRDFNQEEISLRSGNFTGDFDYLTTDFISDFYKRMLEEKVINKSELWNEALKHFTINNNGITFTGKSQETKAKVKLALQSQPILYDNLKNYALISKDNSLDFLRDYEVENVMSTIDNRRDFSINHPNSVEKYTGEYTKPSDNTVIVKNSNNEFIRMNDGIYEITNLSDGVSIYSKVVGNIDENFYRFNNTYPVVEDIDIESFKDLTDEELNRKTLNISDKRLKQTEDRLSCRV